MVLIYEYAKKVCCFVLEQLIWPTFDRETAAVNRA
jgi:hypothetical protein